MGMNITNLDLSHLSKKELKQAIEIIKELERREKTNQIYYWFPEEGEFSKDKYPHFLEFFKAGSKYRQRCLIAANRVGKTNSGGYEVACHATGIYPSWWEGRKFDHPPNIWACGKTGQTVRDIVQKKLLGPPNEPGTGMIPLTKIYRAVPKRGGVADAVESVDIVHKGLDGKDNGYSRIGFKSYDQGRQSFEGTEQDVIWLDEENDLQIYSECLIRTMTVDGIIIYTFTPLQGLSETVMLFLPDGRLPAGGMGVVEGTNKWVVNVTWDDVPHISDEQKAEFWASTPPHQREARSKGVPSIGSGVVYPVLESDIVVDDFDIPAYWPKAYGLDVGWDNTAAVWGAWDRESDTIYIYSNYKRGQAEAVIHTEAIKARGEWVSGVVDSAAAASSQVDGRKLMDLYTGLGLHLANADKSVDAGIQNVWMRLSTGRLKIFKSCTLLLEEMRVYRRDEKGRIVKTFDHCCDALRYLIMSGEMVAVSFSETEEYNLEDEWDKILDGCDRYTGY